MINKARLPLDFNCLRSFLDETVKILSNDKNTKVKKTPCKVRKHGTLAIYRILQIKLNGNQ